MEKRRLFISTIMSFVFAIGGLMLLANSNIDSHLSSIGSRATAVSSEINLIRKNCISNNESGSDSSYIATLGFTTDKNNPIYLQQKAGALLLSSGIANLGTKSSPQAEINFYRDDAFNSLFAFQMVESFNVTLSRANVSLTLYTSNNGVAFFSKGNYTSSSSSPYNITINNLTEDDKYFRFLIVKSTLNDYAATSISSINIQYSCQNKERYTFDGAGKTYSATFKNSANVQTTATLEISNDPNTVSYYKYKNTSDGVTYITTFTWSFNEYDGYLVCKYINNGEGTGNTTSYQNRRFLYAFSSGAYNNGVVGVDCITFYLWTTNSLYSVWSTPVTFTVL